MISESKMKALKKARNKNYAHFELNEEYDESEICFASQLPYGPHAPNKNESKALRNICAKTGLKPSEVRKHKKYRQELAKAAKNKVGINLTDHFKYIKKKAIRIRKNISATTNIHPLSASFFSLFEKEWNSQVHYFSYKTNPQKALELSLIK